MTVQQVLALIQEIRDEPGRNEKLRLLKSLAESELGKFVLKWTYDPLITYGIKPGRTEHQSNFRVSLRPSLIEGMLRQLALRQLTGHAAEAEVGKFMMELDSDSGELLYMILNQDLRCGINTNSVAKVMPDLFKVMRVMRAQTYTEKRVKSWPQVIEPKLDGHRTTFVCREGAGGFFTRTGHRVVALEHLVDPLMDDIEDMLDRLPENDPLLDLISTGPGREGLNFVIDSEAMTEGTFNELSGALRRESEDADAKLHIYDLLSVAEFDDAGPVERKYIDRRAHVEAFVKALNSPAIVLTPRYFVRNHDEAMEYYGKFLEAGYEGAMIKNPDGFYARRQSVDWLKVKPEDSEDLPIVGFFNGERDSRNENGTGGIIVDRNGVEVRVSGIKDAMRAEIHKLWLEDVETLILAPNPGFKGQSLELEEIRESQKTLELSLLGRLVEVEYNVVTEDGSLRHPRFIRFRDDKSEPTVLEAAE